MSQTPLVSTNMPVARQRTTCSLPTKPYTIVLQDPQSNRPVYLGTTKSERAAAEDFERQVALETAASGIDASWTVTLYAHTEATQVNTVTSAGDPDRRNGGKPYLIAVSFPGSRVVRQSTPEARNRTPENI